MSLPVTEPSPSTTIFGYCRGVAVGIEAGPHEVAHPPEDRPILVHLHREQAVMVVGDHGVGAGVDQGVAALHLEIGGCASLVVLTLVERDDHDVGDLAESADHLRHDLEPCR